MLLSERLPERRCHAKSKKTQQQCRRLAMVGNTVCYLHGGRSRRGIFSPQYKTGKYSKYLPVYLKESFETAIHDPDLLELRAELALCYTRLTTLLQQLDVEGTVAAWTTLRKALKVFRDAEVKGDIAAMRDHLTTISRLITDGAQDMEVWSEVYTVMETRRRLIETEHKRLVAGQHMLTAERATLLVSTILETVKDHIMQCVPPEYATKLMANLSTAFGRMALLEASAPQAS